MKSCYSCKYLEKITESWELPDIYVYECKARHQNSWLRQFPFKKTNCKKHEYIYHPGTEGLKV